MKALFLVVAVAVLSVGQPAGGPIAGSWAAEFEGRTFIRLELKTVNSVLTGGISIGNFEVDAQGAVKRADDAPRQLTPIFDVRLRGSNMTFSRKDVDDTDQFSLRLLDTGDADLQFLLKDEDREALAASGVPIPKPIRLSKAG
jgi:hypothetical protein